MVFEGKQTDECPFCNKNGIKTNVTFSKFDELITLGLENKLSTFATNFLVWVCCPEHIDDGQRARLYWAQTMSVQGSIVESKKLYDTFFGRSDIKILRSNGDIVLGSVDFGFLTKHKVNILFGDNLSKLVSLKDLYEWQL